MSGLSCLFDPGSCIESGFSHLIHMVPWWGWVILAIVLVGVVWHFAGWPGLIALALLIGYGAGRFRVMEPGGLGGTQIAPPPLPKGRIKKRPKPKTLEDLFKDGLG